MRWLILPNFVCQYKKCPYYQPNQTAIGYENNNSNILLIFQAPGNDEWTGNTMTGNKIPIDSNNSKSCANRMRKSFKRNKVFRGNFDIAEAVCCYPGKSQNGRDNKPWFSSMALCSINMVNILVKKRYQRIICFGDVAYDVVTTAITQIVNWSGPNSTLAPHPSSGIKNAILDNSY